MKSNVFSQFSFVGNGLDARQRNHVLTPSLPPCIEDAGSSCKHLELAETGRDGYSSKRDARSLQDESARRGLGLLAERARISRSKRKSLATEQVCGTAESKPPRMSLDLGSCAPSDHDVQLVVDIEDTTPPPLQVRSPELHDRADENEEDLSTEPGGTSNDVVDHMRSSAQQVVRLENPEPANKFQPSQSLLAEHTVKAEVQMEIVEAGVGRSRQEKVHSSLRRKGYSSEAVEPPANWELVIDLIRDMRIDRNAPVDLFGTHQLIQVSASEETQRFHAVVAGMISSQTRDAVTAAAMKRLHAMPGGLTVETVSDDRLTIETLAERLKPVGFYRQKAGYLKKIAETLSKPPYNGSVPGSVEELMKLPGVGPKVALLVLCVAFGRSEEGIIVDTNVRRVCSRLGWVAEHSTPEQTRKTVEQWLPKTLWGELSFLFVGFGQQVCKPVAPACATCMVSNLCPAAFSFKQKKMSGGANKRSKTRQQVSREDT